MATLIAQYLVQQADAAEVERLVESLEHRVEAEAPARPSRRTPE
jgi:hypothetical protein